LKTGTEAGGGLCQHLAHRGTVELGLPRARGLASRSEQSERGHARMVVAPPRTGTATLARVPAPDTSQPTRILTIRHGESEWNAIGRWQGQEDPPLTDAGMLQAVAAAEVLGTFDAVWASTLQRAANTAAIIAEAIGIGPVQLDPDLMENAFGPWQGLTISEIEEGWPNYLAEHRRPPGAEQPEEVTERGLRALRRIAGEHPGGEVLVVTHGGLMRTLRRALGGNDDQMRFTNLGGCWFHVHPDGRVVAGDPVHLIEPQAFGDTL
jgi:probable phosphoglycerate mutase